MTERLSALLHEEVDRLAVPVPCVRESLAAGRRIRHRRRLTHATAVVAVVAVVGIGAALVGGGGPDRVAPDPAQPSVDPGPVYAIDDVVYLDRGTTPVQMREMAQAMYYTSAGLLVRTNETGASDGGAPFHFELVHADGTTSRLDLTLGEVVPSTDADQPYVAYTQVAGGQVQVVVHDVSSDEEVRVAAPDVGKWGGWEAPPVGLDGDLVYVGSDTETRVVNWRTGEVLTRESLTAGTYEVRGGRAVTWLGKERRVLDARTGEILLEIGEGLGRSVDLSPDGRYVFVCDCLSRPSTVVHDLETGKEVGMQGPASSWTAGDEVLMLFASGPVTCAPDTGACSDPLPWPDGFQPGSALVRVPGLAYES